MLPTSEGAVLAYKRPVLDSTGTRYNSLYYNAYNSDVSALECTFGYNYRASLSSPNFGSSSTIQVPIGEFISSMVLHLELPALINKQIIQQSWGLAMIDNIAYTIGASNSTQIVLQSESIIQGIMMQVKDQDTRSEILEQAGFYLEGQSSGNPVMHAYVLLPIPPICDFCGHLPLDSSLLLNNITVNIQFKSDPRTVYGGTAFSSHPTKFNTAEIIFRKGKLSNQAASIKQEMIKSPDKKYNIPFIHMQNFQSASFQGKTTSDCSIELNTFPNADLVGICFWVIQDKYKFPDLAVTSLLLNVPPNPYVTDEISDINVTLGGATLFTYPAKSYRLTNMLCKDQGPSDFFYNVIDQTDAAYPGTRSQQYPVFLDFSFYRSACTGGSSLENTFRIPNNQLRVSFKTETTENYTLYATYFVNGVCVLENGTSSIYIS